MFLVFSAICSCDREQGQVEIDRAFDSEFRKKQNSFAPFIASFTDGRVFDNSRIRVGLVSKSDKKPGTIVDDKIFNFKPEIEGSAVWLDSYTVEFTPTKKLLPGILYEADFNLGLICDVDPQIKKFPMKFYTQKQRINVEVDILVINNASDSAGCSIVGTVEFANPVNILDLYELVVVELGEEKQNVEWQEIGSAKYKFIVNNIEQSEIDNYATVSWDANKFGCDDSGKRKVEIPAKGSFKIIGHRVDKEKGIVVIHFSKELSGDLKSYVSTNADARFEVDGNKLTVSQKKFGDSDEMHITIKRGLESKDGEKLKSTEVIIEKVINVAPAVEMLGKGNIAAQSSGVIVPFRARGLYSVDVRIVRIFDNNMAQFFQANNYSDGDDHYYSGGDIARVGKLVSRRTVALNVSKDEIKDWKLFKIDLSDFLDIKRGELYKVILSFRKELSLYKTGQGNMRTLSDEGELDRYWTSLNYYYPPYNEDSYGSSDEPRNDNYYNYNRWSERNFLASDIAMVAKKGMADKFSVQCIGILKAEPMSGIKVSLLSYQQQEIASGVTDNHGVAELEYSADEMPFLLVATKGESTSYLRVFDGDVQSVSNFDVSGERTVDGLKAFIYGERDVWRPGDSIFLNVMIEDKDRMIPQNHPIVMTLSNPDGVEVCRQTERFEGTKIYEFPCATSTSAKTGRWNVSVSIGNSLFSKTIKIETIKPNKIKALINVDNKKIYTPDDVDNLEVKADWLHGSPASDLNANVEVTFSDAKTSFDNFSQFEFDDKYRKLESSRVTLFDGKLNSEGEGAFNLDSESLEYLDATGVLNMQFVTKVYEKSGDFSIASQSCRFSPYKEFVGINIPKDENTHMYFETGKNYNFNLKTVDKDGKPISVDDVEVRMYKLSWSWWWESRYGDFASFNSSSYREVKRVGKVDTDVSGNASLAVNIPNSDWGYYIVKVRLPNGNTCSDVAYFDYPGSYGAKADEGNGAGSLYFTAKKDSYELGETVELDIPSTEGGKLLVSIENGHGILQHFTQNSEKGSTSVRFKAKADMTPNVYVSVLAIQPHAKTVGDLPIRMFGIANVNVTNANSHLAPLIDLGGKDKFLSGDELSIKISEKNKQKMYYSLSIVDEGLLSLTNFHTPSPWPHFNKKVALGVKTWDLYDNIFGAMSGEYAMLSPAGGSDFIDYGAMQDINAKRFKPIVKYFGVFELGANKTDKFSFKIPEYNGQLRVQVVALSADKAYGESDKSVTIRNPITMYVTMPRVLRPGEKVKIPVVLFCEETVKDVSVKLTSIGPIKFDKISQTVKATPGKEQIVYFEAVVADKIGEINLNVTAESAKSKSESTISIGVFPASPEITESSYFTLKGGETLTKEITNIGMEGSNVNSIELSRLPSINLSKRLDFLVQYPHGCAEQKTSGLFAQLYLEKLTELTPQKKQEIANNINNGIRLLCEHQKSDGNFSYWRGGDYVNLWANSYVGNFLVEAKRMGYSVSQSVMDNWISAETRMAKNPDLYYENPSYGNMVQAYRLYALALAGKPSTSAMNIMRNAKLSKTTKYMLASAYALVGEKNVGLQLVQSLDSVDFDYEHDNSTFGSGLRDDAIILEAMLTLGQQEDVIELAENISKNLGTNTWYSTQTTAFCLKAFGKMAAESHGDGKLKASIDANETKRNITSSASTYILELEGNDKAITIENKGEGLIYGHIVQKGVPKESMQESTNSKVEIDVDYFDKDGNVLDIRQLKLGQTVVAQVSLYNPTNFTMEYLAVEQLVPSGWEIINKRLFNNTTHTDANGFHQDIRDDRVYSYLNLPAKNKYRFRVELTAAYLGEFSLPSVAVEAMYDNSINASVKGARVSVVQ